MYIIKLWSNINMTITKYTKFPRNDDWKQNESAWMNQYTNALLCWSFKLYNLLQVILKKNSMFGFIRA